MFEVKGLPILVDEIEILTELRTQVYEQQGREILRKIKRSGNNLMVCCPNHNDGQERKPSCGITTTKIKDKPAGTIHCFACGYTDDLPGFITKCFQQEDRSFGTKWLLENFVTGESIERPNLFNPQDYSRTKPKPQKIEYVTEEELAQYRFYHPYMWERKLTKEIVEQFDIGYQRDFYPSKEWSNPVETLTFPVRDKNGNCLFVSRRAIYGKSFYLPQDMEKPVYGVYELPKNCTDVVICESVFNALTCIAYGMPALALFGTGADEQYTILNNLPIRHYILGLDPDDAGEKGCYKLKKNLKNKILTKLVIPKGKDINDLSKEEFYNLQEIFI